MELTDTVVNPSSWATGFSDDAWGMMVHPPTGTMFLANQGGNSVCTISVAAGTNFNLNSCVHLNRSIQ
jgi:hypothetical protein